MKRGLKPQDSGTDGPYKNAARGSPMKRGLKLRCGSRMRRSISRRARLPDEEGTETSELLKKLKASVSRARLPDEEGTEIEPRRHIALPISASKLALPFSAV